MFFNNSFINGFRIRFTHCLVVLLHCITPKTIWVSFPWICDSVWVAGLQFQAASFCKSAPTKGGSVWKIFKPPATISHRVDTPFARRDDCASVVKAWIDFERSGVANLFFPSLKYTNNHPCKQIHPNVPLKLKRNWSTEFFLTSLQILFPKCQEAKSHRARWIVGAGSKNKKRTGINC
jgi:hypothetical protein